MKRNYKNGVITLLIVSFAVCLIRFSPVIAIENTSISATDNTEIVIPSSEDFDFSKGTINGLKSTYLNQLNETQKKNIQIIIPKEINGIDVTAIATYAFYSVNSLNKNCIFTHLDLSAATSLKTIGDYAFYGYPQLTGTLVLPDSLTSIGRYAFYNTGFTGELVLPSGLTQISDSAFRQTNVTKGFSSVIIPEGVTTIQKYAFLNQNGITNITFPSQSLISIGESAFKYNDLSGVLKIPESIQTIDKSAFSYTNITTVYLPLITNTTNYLQSNTFGNCSKLQAIVCDESNYSNLYSLLQTAEKAKLGYDIEVSFNDGVNTYPTLNRLYNRPLNLIKANDQSWNIDSTYQLPVVLYENENNSKKWNFTSSAITGVSESTLVTGKILYAVAVPGKPVITYGDDIDAVYDGNSYTLSVNATHPLYKNINDAKENDVVFYYTWNWLMIGSSGQVSQGFDVNEYSIKDVREPNYEISCRVTVQACVVKNNKAVVFYTDYHDFGVLFKQSESIVHPVYPTSLIKLANGFPEIKLSDGDTKGTITWDDEQTLLVGEHSYNWTFTPEKNEVGNSNYKVVKGTATLKCVDGEIFNVNVTSTGLGKVNPSGSLEIGQGQDMTLIFEPDLGYSASKVFINGKDVTKEVVNNKYTIKNIQANCDVQVTFETTQADDVKNMIDNLPVVEEGQEITPEQIDTILNTKLNMEFIDNETAQISKEEKEALCDALAQIPQINSAIEASEVKLENKNMLLENMSYEDIMILKNDPLATISIAMKVDEVKPDVSQTTLIQDVLKGATLSDCFNIDITKMIQSNNTVSSTPLSELKSPVKLVLNIPEELIGMDDQNRFFIIRVHSQNGETIVERLEDEDDNPLTITISSDKYSLYALAYEKVKEENTYVIEATTDENGKMSPSGKITVKEGTTQNFIFTPNKGYEVDNVYLNGEALGPITSYTIENINRNYNLKVTFKKKVIPTESTFTIIFYSQGGSAVDSLTGIKENSLITQPVNPIREGYLFTGWYKEAECLNKWVFNQDKVNTNLILYAGWQKETVKTDSPKETEGPYSNQTQPKTGDRSHIILSISLLVSALLGIVWLMYKKIMDK